MRGLIEVDVENFERFLEEEHEVPLNTRGEERTPEEWLGDWAEDDEDRARAAIRADRDMNRVGFGERRAGATWIPSWAMGGGMAEAGYLWLCFDDNTNYVVDVSMPPWSSMRVQDH